MPDPQQLTATLRDYIVDLDRNAAFLRSGEAEDTPNSSFAEAYLGCARDLRRILDGSLSTADL